MNLQTKAVNPPTLEQELRKRIIGQDHAIDTISPYVRIHEAGLSPDHRPAGIFSLLGPTGVGKTRIVEALAEVLHGAADHMIRIDCGEFQEDHEICKLLGAPPSYLGHRQTDVLINNNRLAALTSVNCNLALVLFDEIEKASPALTRLLLGVYDKGTLQTGDNQTVKFQNTMIFMTSNLGSYEVQKAVSGYGLDKMVPSTGHQASRITNMASQKFFAAEFLNRVDETITFNHLDNKAIEEVLTLELSRLRQHIETRLKGHSFHLIFDGKAKAFLLEKGYSKKYGARELKRMITRYVLQPVSKLVIAGGTTPGCLVNITTGGDELKLSVKTVKFAAA